MIVGYRVMRRMPLRHGRRRLEQHVGVLELPWLPDDSWGQPAAHAQIHEMLAAKWPGWLVVGYELRHAEALCA